MSFFRGFRFVSPVVIAVYLHLMYIFYFGDCASDCDNDVLGTIIASAIITMVFIAPLPHVLTRKIILIKNSLETFSIFSGKKLLMLNDIVSISHSKRWTGMVIKTSEAKIVVEKLLSGCGALIHEVERSLSDTKKSQHP